MITPLRDLLYIIPLKPPSTRSGLILPGYENRRPTQGIVKYRGPLTSGTIKRGDHVVFGGWDDGSVLMHEDEGTLYIMPEDYILATIGEGENYLFTKDEVLRLLFNVLAASDGGYGIQEEQVMRRMKDELKTHFQKELHF